MNKTEKAEKLYSSLKKAGIDFFVSVPCKFHQDIIKLLECDSDIIYTPVTREEEGVGVVAGAYLAGKKPALIMQNSGLGNSVNAISSLLNYYNIPVLYLISHRGSEGELINAQVPMGNITMDVLDLLNIKAFIFEKKEDTNKIVNIVGDLFSSNCSVAILLPISFWG